MSVFRKVRGISDQQLAGALVNHKATLEGLIVRVRQLRLAQKVTTWWLVGLTLAIIYLVVTR